MSSSRGGLLVVTGLLGLVAVEAFPGRVSRAADLWCPEAALTDGQLEPVLKRIVEEGPRAWGDTGVPENTPPPWMDKKRMAAGRAFLERYPLASLFGHVHGLYLLFAVRSVLDVLVFTGNSDTPDEAFIRYMDTLKGVGSWYSSDFFTPGTPGYEQLKRVRSLHSLVRKDMADRPQDEVRNKTRIAGSFKGCPMSAALRRDLGRQASTACPRRTAKQDADNDIGEDTGVPGAVWMSQYDMSVTQWAFVGPIIQFPERYGVGNASVEELDGFVHLWEVIGYTLGIDDRFNFCQGGLEPTVRRSREVLSTIVLPGLRAAPPPWEYMARCMADGLGYLLPGVGFETQLASLLSVTLDSPAPAVASQLSAAQRQAVAGYRGVMDSLRRDGDGVLLTPVRRLYKQILPILSTSVPLEDVKRLRHRRPHRSKNCYPEL
ncbi:uncharacterized protein LOC113208219 isoform X2 [Frankliniella occidentalis]|uniref:Uncharacterized protein LOC113208219 isoform X2 n=1 Tax=Frankliniella occidentalis TaxID=133901 RepID=A0A9C6U5Y4_FRAOC|nr:uncharacterized protein LOC113208219 isoform X2 [Frankliniella occidentalis]